MKKRQTRIRVNAKKSHSDLMLRSLLLSLLEYGKVETTQSRVRALKQYADKELSYCVGLEGPMLKNRLSKRVGTMKTVQLLILYRTFLRENKDLTARSGLTSIVKTRFRAGDNAMLQEISLVGCEKFLAFVQAKKLVKKRSAKKALKKPVSKSKVTKKESEVPSPEMVTAKKESEAPKQKSDTAVDTGKAKKKEKKKRESEKKDMAGRRAVPGGRPSFLSQIGGRILGRKVKGPEIANKSGRSTARSGI